MRGEETWRYGLVPSTMSSKSHGQSHEFECAGLLRGKYWRSRSCLHLFLEFGFVAASQVRYDSFLRYLGRLMSAEVLYVKYLRVSHILCLLRVLAELLGDVVYR